MKIVDIETYRKHKKHVEEMSKKKTDLDMDEVLQFSSEQGEIIEALLNDIALLTGKHVDLQNQFQIVSAQAYLALQFLQEKGIVMEEELHGRWAALLKKIAGEGAEEEQQPQRPPIPANLPGAYEPTDEDMARIIAGEPPEVVFAGRFDDTEDNQ
jgi:hypothetical protein